MIIMMVMINILMWTMVYHKHRGNDDECDYVDDFDFDDFDFDDDKLAGTWPG